MGALNAQHTDATGQVFAPEAVERALWWSLGHTFLVDAIADIAFRMLASAFSTVITARIVDQAKESLRIWRQRCWRKEIQVDGRLLHILGA